MLPPLLPHLQGSTVTVHSSQPLAAASKRPASREDLLKAIGQLGDNALALGQVDMEGLGLDQGGCGNGGGWWRVEGGGRLKGVCGAGGGAVQQW
jgi:hypothetical protein